jgi:hypothetical protein
MRWRTSSSNWILGSLIPFTALCAVSGCEKDTEPSSGPTPRVPAAGAAPVPTREQQQPFGAAGRYGEPGLAEGASASPSTESTKPAPLVSNPCPTCEGKGVEQVVDHESHVVVDHSLCLACSGGGRVDRRRGIGPDARIERVSCEKCGGFGFVKTERRVTQPAARTITCRTCNGKGSSLARTSP